MQGYRYFGQFGPLSAERLHEVQSFSQAEMFSACLYAATSFLLAGVKTEGSQLSQPFLHANKFSRWSGDCAHIKLAKPKKEMTITEQRTVREDTFMRFHLFPRSGGRPA